MNPPGSDFKLMIIMMWLQNSLKSATGGSNRMIVARFKASFIYKTFLWSTEQRFPQPSQASPSSWYQFDRCITTTYIEICQSTKEYIFFRSTSLTLNVRMIHCWRESVNWDWPGWVVGISAPSKTEILKWIHELRTSLILFCEKNSLFLGP